MLTVDSFCRRVFAPRPTDMILYYLFFIIYSLLFILYSFSSHHPRPLSFHKKFPDIFCLPLLTNAPVGSIIMLTYEQSFI